MSESIFQKNQKSPTSRNEKTKMTDSPASAQPVRLRLLDPANHLTTGIDLRNCRHTVCVLSAAGTIIAKEAPTPGKESFTPVEKPLVLPLVQPFSRAARPKVK